MLRDVKTFNLPSSATSPSTATSLGTSPPVDIYLTLHSLLLEWRNLAAMIHILPLYF
jgi:hypothetical protein